MKILAIDTSADETSVAITEGFRVLASTIASQIRSHSVWGGIVPSIAKLAHVERIEGVVTETLRKAHVSVSRQSSVVSRQNNVSDKHLFCADDGVHPWGTAQAKHGVEDTLNVGAVAVTYGPGLSIALEVGIKKAKELAMAWNVPLIAVNHMEGHLYSPFVQNSKGNPHRKLQFPFLSLLISGGHTQIVLARENGKYEIVGETVDDSAGEALDKAAKMLGLGYPGGPIIERLASDVDNIDVYKFPRPMMHTQRLQNRVLLVTHPSGGPRHLRKTDFLNASDGHNQCSMSFSGLKTHLYYFLKGEKGQTVDVQQDLKYIASAFQEAVFDSVVRKFERAADQTGVKRWAVGGGVSINKRLRYLLRSLAHKYEANIVFPPYPYLCGDNAAMIGVAAHMQAQRGDYVKEISSLERIPRLKL